MEPRYKSTNIIASLVNKLEQQGVDCTMLPSQDSYVLKHNKTKEEFHTVILATMADLELTAQDEAWLPGNPEGADGAEDAFGYYVYGKEYDSLEDDEFWEMDIFISNEEIQWV